MRWIPAVLATCVVLIACVALDFAPWAIGVFSAVSLAAGAGATRVHPFLGVVAGLLAPVVLLAVLFAVGGGGH